MITQDKLLEICKILLKEFGTQGWWPTLSKRRQEEQFEICIGAILTQNTSWQNVEKALSNIARVGLLSERKLRELPLKKLAALIKPAGYYNKKAEKLKAFLFFLKGHPIKKIENMSLKDARKLLLEVYGIGKETADSMLLYAFNKPIFVIDAYTKRIFNRLFNLDFKSYEEWQEFFMKNLPNKAALFNEYHALLVKLGKDYCKTKPLCEKCGLNNFCSFHKD
jgi:endonuclease-3 related protein